MSRKQLQVLLLIPIEVLGDKFEKQYPSDEIDKVAWKNFFNKNAKFQTLCINCIQDKQEIEKQKAARRSGGKDMYSSDDDDGRPKFGPVFLTAASTAIILKWKRNASDVVRKRGGRTALAGIISDDDSDDDGAVAWAKKRLKLNAASKALAIRWLRMARSKKIGGSDVVVAKGREKLQLGRKKKMDKKKQFGVKPRSGKKKKQSRGALRKKKKKKP